MSDAPPGAAAPQTEAKFASLATVKRRKLSYGKAGVLILTDTRLIFRTSEESASWTIPTASIVHLRKPWYGMGSYLTFAVDCAYYALAFGQRGPNALASASELSIRYGGSGGVAAGVVGDAIVVGRLRAAGNLGTQWFELLSASAAAR